MKIYFLMTLLLSLATSVQAKRVCVCEIGHNSVEEPFYRAGCAAWIAKKVCLRSKIVKMDYGETLSDHLPKLKDGDKLHIGFVGHWSSSYQTERFVQRNILPIFDDVSVKVTYDNTACSPMSEPQNIQDFLSSLELPKGSSLTIKGSQGISLGLWDAVSISKANFYAEASTEFSTPKYPKCKKYEGKKCSGIFQPYTSGYCVDPKEEGRVTLSCEPKRKRSTRRYIPVGRTRYIPIPVSHVWTRR